MTGEKVVEGVKQLVESEKRAVEKGIDGVSGEWLLEGERALLKGGKRPLKRKLLACSE